MNSIRFNTLLIPIGIAGFALASHAAAFDTPLTLAESIATGPVDNAAAPTLAPAPAPTQFPTQPAEMPAVTVVGEGESPLREEDHIGSYGQPRWTATRRFPGTRIYVIPENTIETEFWTRFTFDRDGRTEIRNLYELEIGLPYRFQVDLYYRSDQVGTEDYRNGAQFEMRWALADWGKIFGNPTIYLEYAPLQDAPDKIEGRLLFGDQIAPRWHWGVNLNAELETGGEREYEYQASGGISYTILDDCLSVGVEGKALFTDVHGDRGNFTDVYLVGPSIQYRPIPKLFINLAPLAGVGPNSPDAEITLNIGYEF